MTQYLGPNFCANCGHARDRHDRPYCWSKMRVPTPWPCQECSCSDFNWLPIQTTTPAGCAPEGRERKMAELGVTEEEVFESAQAHHKAQTSER